MKKKVRLLLLTFLLAVSSVLPVYAAGTVESTPFAMDNATATFGGFYRFNSARSVTAGTTMEGEIVMIISDAYSDKGNSIGNGGNAGRSITSTTYSASEDIAYIINTYSAPELGISSTQRVNR